MSTTHTHATRRFVSDERNAVRLVDEARRLFKQSLPGPIGMRSSEQVAIDTAANRLRGEFTDEETEQAVLMLSAAMDDESTEDDILGSEWNAPERACAVRYGTDSADESRYGEFLDEIRRLKAYYCPSNIDLYNAAVHDMQAQGDTLPEEACGMLHDRSQLLHKLDMLCRLAELHVKGRYEMSSYYRRGVDSELNDLVREWSEAGFTVDRWPDSYSPMLFTLGSMARDMVHEELQQFPLA